MMTWVQSAVVTVSETVVRSLAARVGAAVHVAGEGEEIIEVIKVDVPVTSASGIVIPELQLVRANGIPSTDGSRMRDLMTSDGTVVRLSSADVGIGTTIGFGADIDVLVTVH